ncbi:MAG: hypothetical protein H0Z19_07405 [Archaeoglobus sp.]|uniref:hypothetical protein n=1 Tax=Archaeoglobus sp. TaxID=1872626 RepID=UPI001D4D3BB5|nr:hypothetical protein [Archaeoglobus sp.]MBO8180291.1 hypothetical protein [Archaeoglobus sp.]
MGRPKKYPGGAKVITISTDEKTIEEFERRRLAKAMTRGEYLRWLLDRVKE